MQSLFGNRTYVDQNAPKEKNVHFVHDTTMVHHEFMGQSVCSPKKFNNQPYISGEIGSESVQF